MLRFFVVGYPWRTTLILALLTVGGLSEGIGIAALLPVLAVASGDEVANGGFGSVIVNTLQAMGLPLVLEWLLGFVVVAIFLKALLGFLSQAQAGYATSLIARDLRLQLIRAVMHARWHFFTQQSVGELTNSISSEAERAAGAFTGATKLFASTFQAALFATVAIAMSWQVTAAGLIFAAISIVIVRILLRRARSAAQDYTDTLKSLTARLSDGLGNIKPLKAMRCEDRLAPLLEAQTQTLNKARRREMLNYAGLQSINEPLMAVLLGVGLYIALTRWSMPLAELLFLAIVFVRLVGHISAMQGSYQGVVRTESAFESIRTATRIAEKNSEIWSGREKLKLENCITFESVSFGHQETLVLRDVSMRIAAGKCTTLLGRSGSGKTTLVDLIVGLYQPLEGVIRIDDKPLAEVDVAIWRGQIGYVPQETILFNDTVLNNVTLGDPSFSRDDVEAALRAADAWSFVSMFPEGLEHMVGERGAQLSGGQRQRISIARALVRKPTLLILDEATAAVDPNTEAAICDTLAKLKGQVTILVISHQFAFAEIADVSYEVRDGVVTKSRRDRVVA